ncbi:Hypothetical protein FKW44_020183, partial [Caligus rogercresseyi]
EEGKEYELNGSKIQSEADIDAPNNNIIITTATLLSKSRKRFPWLKIHHIRFGPSSI